MSTPVQPHATTGLFAEFAAATSAEWRCEAEAALAGASFEKRLFTPTPEGLTLRPIYFVEDVPAARRTADFPAQADYGRGLRASGYRARSWRIAAQISTPSPREARAAFDAEQVRGLEVLNLAFAPAIYSGGLGLEATYPVGPTVGVALGNLADAEALFRGMDFDKVEFRLEAGAGALPMAAMLFAALDLDDAMLAKMRGVIAADPLGACARFGCQPCSRESIWLQMGALAGWVSPRAPGLAVWEASGLPYADAGANAVEELAFTLATAVEYARALTPRLRGATAATRVGAWALSVGPHFFTEIAKFRAARVLWARALEAVDAVEATTALRVHARTGRWNKSVLDAHTNLLRSTTEALAAICGGADSLDVLPFDEAAGAPDAVSRRLARNQQLILAEECELRAVADSAGGSWYVETLTEQIAAAAWALFQEVEKRGGMAAALQAGFPQEKIVATATQRRAMVEQRRTTFIGVNLHPQADDKESGLAQIERTGPGESNTLFSNPKSPATGLAQARTEDLFEEALAAVRAGATVTELTAALRARDAGTLFSVAKTLAPTRAAESFEELRAAAARAKAAGRDLRVYLANLGPAKQHKARADFSAGFFGVGGFEIVYPQGHDTPAAAAQAALASGAPVIVICGTDENYPAAVPALASAVKAARSTAQVWLAGAPGDNEAAFRAAGLDNFISIKSNVATTLRQLLQTLGCRP